ncbi:hypothetical protein [Solidesulfovibrio sp. C21]|uniref:hypothetical protein n=1 Tax=Solidesulfovibrio sp. C21 TaxID=3398613 RepID=UPI0039FD1AFB
MHGFYEYGTYGGGLISFLITLAILALIFLVCREIVCWYWKINRAMELMERQNLLLERIEAKISAVSGSNGKTS